MSGIKKNEKHKIVLKYYRYIIKKLTPREKWTFILEALCETEESSCMMALRSGINYFKY